MKAYPNPNRAKLLSTLMCLLFSGISVAQDVNSFDRKLTYTSPWFVEFADVNGDKILDMVGVNGNSNTNIEIHHGSADGTFTLAKILDGGASGEYYRIFLPEFNGDGVPDILAVSSISGKLYLSSPSGYVEAVIPGNGLFNHFNTLVADFNEDGHDDMFIKNECFINDGTGKFASTDWLQGIAGAVVTDFNNDGHSDIVMAQSANGTIIFFAGHGDGTFDETMVKPVSAQEVIAFDVNADGYTDIVAKGTTHGEVITIFNDATFAFSKTSTLQLGHSYYSVLQIFDIDLDGKADLVTSNDNDIQYRPIQSDGSFGQPLTIPIGMGSLRGMMFKDAIGDAFADLIVMNGFGKMKIFSDKLNASVEFLSKVYDGLPFNACYKTTPVQVNATVTFTNGSVPKDAGAYAVKAVVSDPNYEGEDVGTATITRKVLTVDVADIAIGPGQDLPPYVLSYSGFAGNETAAVLSQPPTATSEVTPESEEGEYIITIAGGSDENYSFVYESGIVSVNIVNGIGDENETISVFPNPAVGRIYVNAPGWSVLQLLDLTGRSLITRGYTSDEISVEQLDAGMYILQVQFDNGTTCRKRVQVK
ncbi:FG-GAP-like repeat-containing protein [Chryseolinea sp. T2]|uniref:FG-GAP-like repeat-containing protein n=1 Tax=Chryseolinea sp. T2 TaxID=3129255 RepID=UPI003077D49E